MLATHLFSVASFMRAELGDAYGREIIRDYSKDRVPPEADLVAYWFYKAAFQIKGGSSANVGLVATNSIRGGANRTCASKFSRKYTYLRGME